MADVEKFVKPWSYCYRMVQLAGLSRGSKVSNRPFRNAAFRFRSRMMGHARNIRRRQHPDLPPNADMITPNLIVGGFIDYDDWRQLVTEGVSIVVSLQAERHDEHVFRELQPEGYLRLPTTDFSPPTVAQLRMGAAFIDQAVRSDRIVLIHCHAGVGRSAMQCAAYFIYAGMSLEQGWELLTSKRPIVHLTERQRAGLEAFAASLEEERSAKQDLTNDPSLPIAS